MSRDILLLIDRDAPAITDCVNRLRIAGYDPVITHSGPEAIDAYCSSVPHTVMVSADRIETDAKGLFQVIRALYPGAPFILTMDRNALPKAIDLFLGDPAAPDAPPGSSNRHAGLSELCKPGRTLAQIERAVIEQAIAREGGSVTRAARSLDVAPSTLYRKIDAWKADGLM